MLTVEAYELVRRKYHLDGISIRKIAKEFGQSRKTVNKVLGLVSPPGYRQSKPRKGASMDLSTFQKIGHKDLDTFV